MVLGVYCGGRYGSLGMSRRSDLMDKPLRHRTLGELVADFEGSYRRYQHSLKKVSGAQPGPPGPDCRQPSDLLWRPPQVKIGLYVPHDPHVFQPIEWKHLVLNVSRLGAPEVRRELEQHGRLMRMKVQLQ